MPRVIVCDVNETLLDTQVLAPHFARLFGDPGLLKTWFSQLLLYSEVATLAGPYAAFGEIGGAALEMLAEANGVPLTPAQRDEIVGGLLTMPAHPDVVPALTAMRQAGLPVVALTNSSSSAATQQLAHAGIPHLFDRIFSVEEVRRFKPAPEPYRHVAQSLGVPIEHLRMVAAHAWDVHGAMRAGCAGAFLARPGKVLFPLGPRPDIIGQDFGVIARRIIETDASRQ